MVLEKEVYSEKREGEIGNGGFCCWPGDGMIEGFVLWLFMVVLRLWRLKTWWREIKKKKRIVG